MIPFHDHFVHKVYFINKERNFLFGANMFATFLSFSNVFRRLWKEIQELRENKGENWKGNLCLLLKHGVDITFVQRELILEQNEIESNKIEWAIKMFSQNQTNFLKWLLVL